MITSLRHSNAQDEHDPTFVEMVKQRAYYENRLDKAVSKFWGLPYCDTPGCPIHETPTASPVKPLPTKRKDEDGFISPPQDTEIAGTTRNTNVYTRNTTLQPKANPATNNLPPPVFLVITENHRTQMRKLNDIYPDLRNQGKSFAQAASTSNAKNNTTDGTTRHENPAVSVTNQASQPK
ncbi:hypothetical protein TNIN_186681 [Trichonephila inaurata madagascariensis]|uniref:Uncharacterized protein n=1 Tax=Trichonephila inaurata madagascariensis TaxID=2747483 RepID=A0A8X6WXE6_9ARAC|nr:hypothetical protein TNIN_186681 [Trichonephila inaurata madagascariensis]